MREVALTTMTLTIPRLGDQALCGSALVRTDPEDAVARSVLAAVNRRRLRENAGEGLVAHGATLPRRAVLRRRWAVGGDPGDHVGLPVERPAGHQQDAACAQPVHHLGQRPVGWLPEPDLVHAAENDAPRTKH